MKTIEIPVIGESLRNRNFSSDEKVLIEKAYEFALSAHSHQKRLSGEPYIIHPLNVAKILLDMGFDAEVIAASLLHDTVEDTGVSLSELESRFGSEITTLVDGVTKISKIRSENVKQRQAENIRKMLLSMVKDIRIIFIKLADKLHNMRTIEYLNKEDAERVARETLEIYAPLAGRLGMARIKAELEDLSLKVLEPEIYEDIKNYIYQKRDTREEYVKRVKNMLEKEFRKYGLNARIEGRAKHFYSIYRKMKEKHKSFEEILDLFAIRIITESVRECYEVLGIVHRLWMPVSGRFKDYIAMPKSNMYQSLHTTVIGPLGKPLEIQIRTRRMNIIAEEGIAAHWAYKEKKRNLKLIEKELTWLKKLKYWREYLDNPSGFMEDLQKDLLQDEIYVFTPKGDVIDLPKGSTPIDFAYKIHTEVGHRCIGAKVNGRIVPLRRPLKSGETVEILTSKNSSPSREWLDIVKTSRARHKIRYYFSSREEKREEKKEEKREEKSQEIKKVLKGQPHERAGEVKEQLKHRKKGISGDAINYALVADGQKNVQMHIAKCCDPHPGESIIGYITRGRGITVHRSDCKNLKYIKDFENRKIVVEWIERDNRVYHLKILAKDRSGLLMDIATAIANANANIIEVHSKTDHNKIVKADLKVQVRDETQLRLFLRDIRQIDNVFSLDYNLM